MEATRILMEEHRVIERVLGSLDASASRLAGGESTRPGFLLEAADFIQGFADGCHHRKEQGLFFPAMETYGVIRGEAQGELAEGFVRIDQEEIGETEHAEFQAMAQALEREAAG